MSRVANSVKKQILDHGYLQIIETWGDDEMIIEAARMSTDKGFQYWGCSCPDCHGTGAIITSFRQEADGEKRCTRCKGTGHLSGDEKLLAYLYNNKHMTPFEMCGMTIEVKAPIFVFREWHRHRTQSYNEMSGRYVPLPDENYIPDPASVVSRVLASNTNKQAGAAIDRLPTTKEVEDWCNALRVTYAYAQDHYERGLALGIPKEIARLPVPVARYSRMRASGNLRNWLAFLTLRDHSAAQWEIREYAGVVADLVKIYFPRTYELYLKEK